MTASRHKNKSSLTPINIRQVACLMRYRLAQ